MQHWWEGGFRTGQRRSELVSATGSTMVQCMDFDLVIVESASLSIPIPPKKRSHNIDTVCIAGASLNLATCSGPA